MQDEIVKHLVIVILIDEISNFIYLLCSMMKH